MGDPRHNIHDVARINKGGAEEGAENVKRQMRRDATREQTYDRSAWPAVSSCAGLAKASVVDIKNEI